MTLRLPLMALTIPILLGIVWLMFTYWTRVVTKLAELVGGGLARVGGVFARVRGSFARERAWEKWDTGEEVMWEQDRVEGDDAYATDDVVRERAREVQQWGYHFNDINYPSLPAMLEAVEADGYGGYEGYKPADKYGFDAGYVWDEWGGWKRWDGNEDDSGVDEKKGEVVKIDSVRLVGREILGEREGGLK